MRLSGNPIVLALQSALELEGKCDAPRIALTRASGVLLRRLARATLERRPDVPPTPSEWARAISRARAAIDGRTVERWISAGIIDVRGRRGDG